MHLDFYTFQSTYVYKNWKDESLKQIYKHKKIYKYLKVFS